MHRVLTLKRELQSDKGSVKLNIESAQQKQKEYYDKKHGSASCFGVGSLVKMKDFKRKKRKGGFIDFGWQGLYTITASLGKGIYHLKELNGEKECQLTVNVHIPIYVCNHLYVGGWQSEWVPPRALV